MGDSRFNQSCSKVSETAAKGASGEEGHLSVVVCTAHLWLPSPTLCRYLETVEDGAATTSVFGRSHEDSHRNPPVLGPSAKSLQLPTDGCFLSTVSAKQPRRSFTCGWGHLPFSLTYPFPHSELLTFRGRRHRKLLTLQLYLIVSAPLISRSTLRNYGSRAGICLDASGSRWHSRVYRQITSMNDRSGTIPYRERRQGTHDFVVRAYTKAKGNDAGNRTGNGDHQSAAADAMLSARDGREDFGYWQRTHGQWPGKATTRSGRWKDECQKDSAHTAGAIPQWTVKPILPN
jgi:hypothetical protein